MASTRPCKPVPHLFEHENSEDEEEQSTVCPTHHVFFNDELQKPPANVAKNLEQKFISVAGKEKLNQGGYLFNK